jgi:hypothetical protein
LRPVSDFLGPHPRKRPQYKGEATDAHTKPTEIRQGANKNANHTSRIQLPKHKNEQSVSKLNDRHRCRRGVTSGKRLVKHLNKHNAGTSSLLTRITTLFQLDECKAQVHLIDSSDYLIMKLMITSSEKESDQDDTSTKMRKNDTVIREKCSKMNK